MILDNQLRPQTPGNWRRTRAAVKRHTAKRARRLGREMLADAPARVTRGWTS